MDAVKLNLGSGESGMALDGYKNLDRKNSQEVYPLVAYSENSVDEIRASHILEHFGRRETFNVLLDWVSKLKIGGVLKIAVPDFGKLAASHAAGEDMDFAGYICGGQMDEDDFHKAIFDEAGLRKMFEVLGLEDVKKWESKVTDCASYPISLNLQGTKTDKDVVYGEITFADEAYKPLLIELASARRNVYSQNGEDGIIEAIFSKIGTQNKWCLEVGAADGIMLSNTRRLVEQGWNAILIEKDEEKYKQLVKNCEKYPNTHCIHEEVNATGHILDYIMSKVEGCPKEIDLVCIDIDGQDWHVWNQMLEYNPRVMVVEFDPMAESPEFIPAIDGEKQAGKKAIKQLATSKLYHNTIVTKYNIIAIRNDIKVGVDGTENPLVINEPKEKLNIKAIMSMPRLCFTDNIFAALRAFVPMKIDLEKGTGVFWGQVLTRLIEKQIEVNADYIFVVDYDTYFTKNQTIKLLQMMQEHPEADAILPLQMKRECDIPLIGKTDEKKVVYTELPTEDFDCELMPVTTGHFGLTIFRTSSFAKLKKPWFLPIPDSDGGWGEGRRDEDIYFWHNFAESGLKAFLAPKIGLPHLQLIATIPGRLEDGLKPEHRYVSDLEKDGLPEWCEPKVELLT